MGTEEGQAECATDSIKALPGLVRTMTYRAKGAIKRNPFDLDGRAFWTHSLFAKAALIHIKYNDRDEQWALDLDVLKKYLQYFAPRYKIYGT